jgi:ABC-type polysaccharide/polyol phosphate export permease
MFQHLTGIWRFRHFWLSLVRLDLRNRYRRSVLGIGWSLLHPLAMTAVWCLAFGQILGQGDWRSLAPILLVGMAVWEFLRNSVLQGCESFIKSEAYIRQCPLPFGIYSLRVSMGLFIHFLIALGVVALAVAVLQSNPRVLLAMAALIPAILMTAIFSWSLCTLAGYANVFFHDTKHLVEVLSQLLFFLTPVMYTRDMLDRQGLGWVADVNPIAYFIDLFRGSLLTGSAPSLERMAQCGGLTLAAAAAAAGTTAWLQKRVVFHL